MKSLKMQSRRTFGEPQAIFAQQNALTTNSFIAPKICRKDFLIGMIISAKFFSPFLTMNLNPFASPKRSMTHPEWLMAISLNINVM